MSYKTVKSGLAAAGILALLAALPLDVKAGHSTGHNLWITNCSGCHGTTAVDPQYNAAGVDSGTLDYVISQVPGMSGLSGLSATTRNSIAQYIATELPSTSISPAMNSLGSFISVANAITAGGIAFSHVRTTSNPLHGTLSYVAGENWAGHTITYTPNADYVGPDSFTYRGYRVGTTTADSRTVNITVGTAPVITSANTKAGTVGVSLTYNIVATNNPSSYSHLGTLPAGLTRAAGDNTITGIPTTATSPTQAITMRATNVLGTASETLTFTIAKGTQNVTFPIQTTPTRTYAPAPSNTFTISPLATTSPPGAGITYSSTTPTKCTVSGTTVTIVSVGDGICTLQALAASTANYNSDTATRNITFVKANQTITFGAQASRPYVQGGTFPITTGTSSSTLTVTYDTTSPTICSVAGTTVSILQSGDCIIRASQVGNGNYFAATQVLRTAVITAVAPVAPTIGTATAGPNQLSVSFTPSSNTGNGRVLTSLRATCNPGGIFNTGSSSPIVVGGLTNGTPYTCSVTATNDSALTSVASGTAGGTPSAAPVAPTINSVNNATFTVLSPNTFTVTASGIPAPTFSVAGGTLPNGVGLNTTTGVISGTPASGTVAAHVVTIRATNGTGFNDQSFTLNVIKANQTIDFTDPPDQAFGLATVPLTATANSSLPVAFTSATPGVCSVSGSNVTLITIGDCTINANRASTADYNAAAQTPQTFNLSKGDQTVTFGLQTTATRPFSLATFGVLPLGTASSNLAVTYGSDSPSICTVAGSTVTMVALGNCLLSATQVGNTNWNPATPVQRTVVITIGSQSITFAASQGAQSFLPGGTFALNPVGSASSGLAISYTTVTPSICTVSGITVTMVATGTCTIAANQEGNSNFAAATPVQRNIAINANVPSAPTIGTATTAASGQLSVSFTPPGNNGGSAILDYTATCNPGAVSQVGAASPIIVSGLANGISHTCSVKARNAVGSSVASATASGTPGAAGPAIWASVCSTCHGDTPAGARFNAAGTTTTVLNHVISHQAEMNVPTVQALTPAERADLVAYITSYLAPVQQFVAPNTPKTISLASHLALNTVAQTFQQVEVVTPPTSGTLGAFTGTSALYTPANGFTGNATFTYRGKNNNIPFNGDTHTATISVDPNLRVLSMTYAGSPGSGIVLVTDPNGSAFCTTNCSEVYPNGTMVTLFAAPEVGFAFSGWSGACSGTDECAITMSSNASVTATFVGAQHDVMVSRNGTGSGTVTSDPAGINCGATCLAPFGASASVTLTATPSPGSVFSGWLGSGCSGTGTCVVTMDATKSVNATFDLAPSGSVAQDFNDDGRSDVLFRNFATGELYRMFMNGFTSSGGAIMYSEADTNWKVIADADFNGDGVSDLLWRHSVSGGIYVMPLTAAGLPAAGAVIHTEPNAAWKILFQPDVNGDGKADILWWNSSTGQVYVMLMNGAAITAQGFAYTEPNTQWQIVAIGDFTGSGVNNQLLWRHVATGQVYQMTLGYNGSAFTQTGAMIYQEPDTAWKILGAADFTGDDKSDILWRNSTTGQVYVMPMNGATALPGAIVYTEANPQWQVVAFGDYNGDGKADLLWRNSATGQLYLVLMNGLSVLSQAMIYVEPNTQWRVMGPFEYGP